VRLGCAEAIYSGTTTINDWAHNIRGPAHADADVRALKDTGIRGRFSYGTYQGGPPAEQTMDIADLERMQREWASHSNEGLLTLGMASRSVSNSPRGAVAMPSIHKDWEAARSGLARDGRAGVAATKDQDSRLIVVSLRAERGLRHAWTRSEFRR
jgi:hypothetical protein